MIEDVEEVQIVFDDISTKLDDCEISIGRSKRSVSFHPETKPHRDFLPGHVLGIILNMELNGVYPTTNNLRSGLEMFNTLESEQKIQILACANSLKQNIVEIIKKHGFGSYAKIIPVSPAGQTHQYVKINDFQQILKVIGLFELNV
jgi:hypothetical protein